MRLLKLLTVRGLLVFLVLIAAVPVLLLVAETNMDSIMQMEKIVGQNAMNMAQNLNALYSLYGSPTAESSPDHDVLNGWTFSVVNVSGDYLFSYPAASRPKKLQQEVLDGIADGKRDGYFRAAPGEGYMYGYHKIYVSGDSTAAAVALAYSDVSDLGAAEKWLTLKKTLLTVAFVLLGVLWALGVGRILIVWPLDRLVKAYKRLTLGDLSARSNVRLGVQELMFLSKSFDDTMTIMEMQDVKRRIESNSIKEHTQRDYLTMAYNRKRGCELLEKCIQHAENGKSVLTVFLINVDNLNFINEKYGYNEGDKVLKRTSLMLKRQLRSRDILCRWSGNEFLVILPSCPLAQANGIWGRMQNEMEHLEEESHLSYTFSLNHSVALYDAAAPITQEELILQLSEPFLRNRVGKIQLVG